ncbi:MAG: carbohydrate porin [Myxococcota bacterium]|nr:carbohydrate porin [Myxococcota bacterium]
MTARASPVPLALLAVVFAAPTLAAAEPWRDREHALGNWAGARDWLGDRGVEPFARYMGGVWANTRGGRQRGARYEGYAEWGFEADLDTAVRWPGARFHAKWISYHGGRATEDLIGASDTNDLSNYEAKRAVRFYTMYLEQILFDGGLRARIGQLAVDDDFFLTEWGGEFTNAAFGDFLGAGSELDPPAYSKAAPGALLEANAEHASLRIGAYTGNSGEDDTDNWGFDWELGRSAGITLLGELAVRGRPTGRSTTWTAGVLYDSTEQRNYRSGDNSDGTVVLWGMVDQTLWVDDGGRDRVGAFARVAYAPQEERVVRRWIMNGGVVLRGPLPGRPDDVAGVAASWFLVSGDYEAVGRREDGLQHDSEGIVELLYRARLAPWLALEPNVQLVFRPAFANGTALALGLRMKIDL